MRIISKVSAWHEAHPAFQNKRTPGKNQFWLWPALLGRTWVNVGRAVWCQRFIDARPDKDMDLDCRWTTSLRDWVRMLHYLITRKTWGEILPAFGTGVFRLGGCFFRLSGRTAFLADWKCSEASAVFYLPLPKGLSSGHSHAPTWRCWGWKFN